ncbi:MAG: hypothetical protein JXR03_01095 [Cyclobacteriaceae bacterium]
MKTICRLACLILITILSSCNTNYELRLLVSEEDKAAMTKIADEVSNHSRFNINVIGKDSLTEIEAINKLLNDDFDITTVDNTIEYHGSKQDLRTVIPFFHEVLVVVSRLQLEQGEIDSLIKMGDYIVLTKEVDELEFFKKLIPNFTGDSSINYKLEPHFNLEKDIAENDILLFFSALENHELGKLLFDEQAYIYSLDHKDTYGKGSFIEGFCQSYKKTTPYIISRYAFGTTLQDPVYTLAVHELLVAQTGTADKVIYDLIETIHQHHVVPIFASSNSNTFEVNHQDINLTFPFHDGTINYINRDKPSFIERYSEFMGFVLSVFIVIFGLGASFKANMNQRKKDRMDEYYHELLELKQGLENISNHDLRSKLANMQSIVFDLLIREKLSANNEFVIFMMLWDEVHQELIKRGN